jgi:hypothetical protein
LHCLLLWKRKSRALRAGQALCRNRHAKRAIRARHANIPCLHCTRLNTDRAATRKNIEAQIDAGVDGIIVCGSTFRRAVVAHIWEGVLPAVTTKFNADFSMC